MLTHCQPQWDLQSLNPTISPFIAASPQYFHATCLHAMVQCYNFSFDTVSTSSTLSFSIVLLFHWLILPRHLFGHSPSFWPLKFKGTQGLVFRPLFFSIYAYFLENLPGPMTLNTIFMLCGLWEENYLMWTLRRNLSCLKWTWIRSG